MENGIEIVKTLQEKIELLEQLLREMIMESELRVMTEINTHNRDVHLRHWDNSRYAEFLREQQEKNSILYKKRKDVDKKLAELIKASNEDDSSGDINKDHELVFYLSPKV